MRRLTFRSFPVLLIAVVVVVQWSLPASMATERDAEKTNNAPAPLQIGAASCVINPQIGDWVQGAGAARRATEIRDDLEANGLYLSDGK